MGTLIRLQFRSRVVKATSRIISLGCYSRQRNFRSVGRESTVTYISVFIGVNKQRVKT